jgi:hypothetical protein
MGGTGSFFRGESKPRELLKKVREAEAQAKDQEFEIEVSKIIGDLLADYNGRDVEATNTHLDEIKKALEKEIEGTTDLRFGGSVAKHTYVDGLSDIDSLVILNNSELKNKTPDEVLEYFFGRLKDRFPDSKVEKGTLAVTVKFRDTEIQLLPAIKYRTGLRIRDASTNDWNFVKQDLFSKQLMSLNEKMSLKLVPTIKLAKSIIANLPEDRQLNGYHVESLAAEIFEDYNGPATPKAMLTTFFAECPKHVLKPISDPSGQSTNVDEYLGATGSLERRLVADALGRIARRMQNADGGRLVDEWRDILTSGVEQK